MAAVHINTSTVQIRFTLVRVVAAWVLLVGNLYKEAYSVTYFLYST